MECLQQLVDALHCNICVFGSTPIKGFPIKCDYMYCDVNRWIVAMAF